MNLVWCIVAKSSGVPFYYAGYFKESKPVITISFDDALKLRSQKEALKIKYALPNPSAYVVEEHGECDAQDVSPAGQSLGT